MLRGLAAPKVLRMGGMRQGGPSVLIEYVCDAHEQRDPLGPHITLLDGRWAYCAGHAPDGHRWRQMTPMYRAILEAVPEHVRQVCDRVDHIERGYDVADGHGVLTVADGRWSYCTAGVLEPHTWRDVAPTEFTDIHHKEIERLIEGGP